MQATRSVQSQAAVSGCDNCRAREARFAQQLDRFRQRSRITSSPRRAARQLESIKGGNLFIEDVNAEQAGIAPDTQFDVDVVVGNGALQIDLQDQDFCGNDANECSHPSPFSTNGYCYVLSVTPPWNATPQQDQNCIAIALAGINEANHTYSLVTPSSPGQYDIEIALEAAGSGERTTMTRTIVVEEEGTQDPSTGGDNGGNGATGCNADADCPEGQVCRNGTCVEAQPGLFDGPLLPCFLDPNRSCATPETIGWGLAGVFVLSTLVAR